MYILLYTLYYILLLLNGFAATHILLYSLAQLHLCYFYVFKPKKLENIPILERDLPFITIQLPIYNEKYVVERLLNAIMALDYPKNKLEIQILDDSTDETSDIIVEILKKYTKNDFDVQYLHRSNREGFKAGALAAGLIRAKGDFIAIFDADFVPEPTFLRQATPYIYSDENVAVVQARWAHLNRRENLLTRLQAMQLDVHFSIEQSGRSQNGCFLQFNGTAGLWRKAAIHAAGGWQSDTLTEDLDLSYRAQLGGWRIVYVEHIAAPAELPTSILALKGQQFRWTKGGAQCARKLLLPVWRSAQPLNVKLHAAAHLLSSTLFIAIFVLLLTNHALNTLSHITIKMPIYSLNFFIIGSIALFLVHYTANVHSQNYVTEAYSRRLFRFLCSYPLLLSISMGLSVHNNIGVWEGLLGRKSAFVRTPKRGATAQNSYGATRLPFSTYLEILFLFLNGAATYNGICHQNYLLAFFVGCWTFGFGVVGIGSLMEYWQKNKRKLMEN